VSPEGAAWEHNAVQVVERMLRNARKKSFKPLFFGLAMIIEALEDDNPWSPNPSIKTWS